MEEIKRQLNEIEYIEYIESEKCRKVFLECLPKWSYGKNKEEIDWEKSINHKVHFIYKDIEGDLDILAYDKNTKLLLIKYNNKELNIIYGNFMECKIGNLIGTKTLDFKIEIGKRFKDDKRDITVIDKKYIKDKNGRKRKYYKYKCLKCGYNCGKHWNIRDKEYKEEYWLEESNLLQGRGCSCCCQNPRIVVENINSIYKTDKWMTPIINDLEFCKTHTHSCGNKIYPTCPDCGKKSKKQYTINTIYTTNKIVCPCSDGIHYTEKIMYSILKQLGINFEIQLSKTTFEWCKNYRYDFYFELNSEHYIVETHGMQHYKNIGGNWDKLEKTQENDRLKKELALQNGIKKENYIVIDCRKSELNWIRDNENGILNSKLNELFDLSNIDWNKCERFSSTNLVKLVCEYKNNHYLLSSKEIGNIFNLNKTTVSKYLKIGNEIGWCIYDIDFERKKGHINTEKKKYIPIIEINTLNIFNSIKECSELSKEIFKVKLSKSSISAVCSNKYYKTIHGYKFKKIEDLSKEEYIKYDIENKLKELELLN